MSQDNHESLRLSGGEDIGSGSPNNSNLMGDDLRHYNNPSRSISLTGSSPTNATGGNLHNSQTKLTRRKSYAQSSEDVSDDDDNDASSRKSNNRRKLRKRSSYRRR